VHFQNAGAGYQRQRLAIFVELHIVAILAIGRGTIGATSSAATAASSTATATAVVPGLAAPISTAASAATTAPSLFLGHVSQNPYLDPLKKTN
jgi:hypothetical protein